MQVAPKPYWKARYDAAFKQTMALCDEQGWTRPTVQGEAFVDNGPVWISDGKGTGRVEIDPSRFDPEAISHELAHGIHEILREDPRYAPRIKEAEGEEFCDMVRHEVEKRLKRIWDNIAYPRFIKQYGGDWNKFTKWVN